MFQLVSLRITREVKVVSWCFIFSQVSYSSNVERAIFFLSEFEVLFLSSFVSCF